MLKAKQAMERAQYDVAVGHLLVARSLVPNASGPYLNLGVAYERLGRCAEAVPLLEEYLRRKPQSPSPIAARSLAACRAQATAAAPPAPASPAATTPSAPAATTPSAPAATTPSSPAVDDGPDAPRVSTPANGQPAQLPYAQVGGVGPAAAAEPSLAVPSTFTATPFDAPAVAGPRPARLTVSVGPVGANLRLNGHPAGADLTHLERDIPPGSYQLYAERPGYQPVSRSGWLVPGEVHIDLLTMRKKRVWPIVVGVLSAALVAGGLVAIIVTQVGSSSSHKSTTGTGTMGTSPTETGFPTVSTP